MRRSVAQKPEVPDGYRPRLFTVFRTRWGSRNGTPGDAKDRHTRGTTQVQNKPHWGKRLSVRVTLSPTRRDGFWETRKGGNACPADKNRRLFPSPL